jgi:protein tyrosine phosphatase (PTP) superfamily phosphohydrolase (DUF442 family)
LSGNKINKIKIILLILTVSFSFDVLAGKENLKRGDMENIINFYQITENIGTGGQPTIGELAKIAEANYSVVVNLAMHDSDNAISEEGDIVSSLGMKYIHIPVPFEAPTSDHLKNFFNVMDSFEDKKVFVHCAVNARVSAFMHQYLTLKKGVSSDQASSPLLNQWLPTMDTNWKSIMELEIEEIE